MSLLEHKIDGFTLAEVIVTLALTSLVITFAYGTLNYVQKLFHSYKDQNRFMQEYTDLKQHLDYEILYSEWIMEQGEDKFKIKRDSSFIDLELLKNVILIRRTDNCDTFHMIPNSIKKEYEPMIDPRMMNRLLRSLILEVEFKGQKFSLNCVKSYDASVKLNLEKMHE